MRWLAACDALKVPRLEVAGLSAGYGGFLVLRDLSLRGGGRD